MSFFVKNNSLLIERNIVSSPIELNSVNYLTQANWNTTTTGNVTSVGTNGGPSAYGTYDQTGNLQEWNNEIYLVSSSYNRGLWGGSYASSLANIGRVRSFAIPSNGASDLGFRLVSLNNPLNYNVQNNMFLDVGDANNTGVSISSGNANGATNIGSVNYNYKIMKFLVTNAEYVIFLNSIASTDNNGVYNTSLFMNINLRGGIVRSGANGSYTYSLKTNFANKPVNFISWYRAARFANWLSNGRPTGSQNSTTTEDGAYTLSGNTGNPTLNSINPNTGLPPTYSLPSENEWVKAAYYKGGSTNAGYWNYATQSDIPPMTVASTVAGDGIIPYVVYGNMGQNRSAPSGTTSDTIDPSSATVKWLAHGFNTGNSSRLTINSITLSARILTSTNVYIGIYSDLNGQPNSLIATSLTVAGVGSSTQTYVFTFNNITLQTNQTYWMVPTSTTQSTNRSFNWFWVSGDPVSYNSNYSYVDTLASSSNTIDNLPSGPWNSTINGNDISRKHSLALAAT